MTATAIPSPSGRVALLDIAHRTVRAARSQIATRGRPRKSLPTAIKTLGDRIQVRRFELGLLQSELAAKLKVPISLLQAWEEDVQDPAPDHWNKLDNVLGTTDRTPETGQVSELVFAHPQQI